MTSTNQPNRTTRSNTAATSGEDLDVVVIGGAGRRAWRPGTSCPRRRRVRHPRRRDTRALHRADGVPRIDGTCSLDEPRLHLLGYGGWTGTASATLIGAAGTTRTCIGEILGRPARGVTTVVISAV